MASLAAFTTVLRRAFTLSPGPGNPWPLFWFSFRNILLSKKKTPLLLLFLLIPLAITLMIASELPTYSSSGDEITSARGGRAWYQDVLGLVFFPLLIPIVTAAYATAVIGEEVEGKTLPYVFSRPLYRSWVLFCKTLSFLLATTILGIVAVTATFFVAVGLTENPFNALGELLGYWGAVALTVFATGGLWLLLGVLMRQAMIAIAIYTFVWETILGSILPGELQKYSLVWYERAFINGFIDRKAGFITEFLVDVPAPGEALTVLLTIGILGFVASLVIVSYRDYNV